MTKRAFLLLAVAFPLLGQTAPKSILGTVSAFHPGSAEFEIKPDTGDPLAVKISSATIAKRVAAGQTDLSKAESINVSDIAIGDRVLVTFGAPDPAEARRLIVIPASDLAKRDAADRADWQKRGVAGIVTAVSENNITAELRSLNGAIRYTITAGPRTNFKRYAADSIRFSDATSATLAELSVGDQIRARGQKSLDGAEVDAEDIVFGTFLSKAGTIASVDTAAREITIKDLANKNKPLVVKCGPEAKIKRMPDLATMQGMLGGRGPAPATASAPPRSPEISQMLELLPALKLEDLKPGEVAVVSAVRGAKPDQISAITFLANAETLVQLAMAARGTGASGPAPTLAGLASSISNVGP